MIWLLLLIAGLQFGAGLPEPYAVVGEHSGGPLVIYCHGAGETEAAITGQDGGATRMAAALAASGYEVVADRSHGNNWGSAASVDDNLGLYAFLGARGQASEVFLIGQSMGALDCLQLALRLPVRAFYGIYPLTDITTIQGEAQSEIQRLGTGGLVMSYSPQVHYRFAASYADTVVPRALNSDRSAQESGGSVYTCKGQHGDSSCFNSQDVLDFFAAAAS